MLRPVPVLDGFGVVFDPETHLRYVTKGEDIVASQNPVNLDPPIALEETVWKDRPAGAKCVALFEDKDCEQFPA